MPKIDGTNSVSLYIIPMISDACSYDYFMTGIFYCNSQGQAMGAKILIIRDKKYNFRHFSCVILQMSRCELLRYQIGKEATIPLVSIVEFDLKIQEIKSIEPEN